MSLNTAHADHGVLIHARECIILFSDNVTVEFYGNDTHEFKGVKTGRMYLTTHRMIFNSKSPSEPLRSFSFPFITLEDVAVEQPMFSANYIKGKIHAQPNGNFIGEVKFKVVFKSGGAIEFGQAMLKAAHLATRHATPDAPPPPYSPPSGPWYAAPPPAYAPPPQGYYGWVPPYTAFPDQPPPNSVFVSNSPPPYPGVMGRPYPPGTGYSGVAPQDSPSPTGAAFPQGPSAPPGYPGAPAGMSSNDSFTCLPDSQPLFPEREQCYSDGNKDLHDSQKRKIEDSDEEDSQSLLQSTKLRLDPKISKLTRTPLIDENIQVLKTDTEVNKQTTNGSDFETENDDNSNKCNLCVFEKELDKRNYYFGNLLIGELQFLPPCMRSEAYINILKYVDSLKQEHRNKINH